MKNIAAGLLMTRRLEERGRDEYFLVHPGGPFFRNKDVGYWTIPKGIPEDGEELIETAGREFLEETGIHPQKPFYSLGTIKQKSGKVVYAWLFSGAWEPTVGIVCNTFSLEWPPRSGKYSQFPEVDKAQWFDLHTALSMIIPEQAPFLHRASALLTK